VRLETLKAVAGETGGAVNQVVIAWSRQNDPSILPIVLGSKIEQLAENIAALGVTLTSEQLHRLDTAGNPVIKQAWLQPS
jgi:aryl-alcohol dehydrogenase-like predicted oxidoreductase